MIVEINVPDEAVDRIEGHLKQRARLSAKSKGLDIDFKSKGIELIKALLQTQIDVAFMETDPDYIEAKKAAKKINEDAQAAVQAKLNKK